MYMGSSPQLGACSDTPGSAKATLIFNVRAVTHNLIYSSLTEHFSYAEMDKAVKNSISHRRKAINNMMDYFTSQKWHVSPTQMEDNKKSKLET